MGCWPSKQAASSTGKAKSPKEKGFKRPEWKSDEPWDLKTLQGKREEFWDTQPAYGGHKEIWDALRAVTADLDNPNNQLILDSAGIIVHHRDLSSTYDERGFKYDLPKFILSEPTNLIRSKEPAASSGAAEVSASSPGNVEMATAAT